MDHPVFHWIIFHPNITQRWRNCKSNNIVNYISHRKIIDINIMIITPRTTYPPLSPMAVLLAFQVQYNLMFPLVLLLMSLNRESSKNHNQWIATNPLTYFVKHILLRPKASINNIKMLMDGMRFVGITNGLCKNRLQISRWYSVQYSHSDIYFAFVRSIVNEISSWAWYFYGSYSGWWRLRAK